MKGVYTLLPNEDASSRDMLSAMSAHSNSIRANRSSLVDKDDLEDAATAERRRSSEFSTFSTFSTFTISSSSTLRGSVTFDLEDPTSLLKHPRRRSRWALLPWVTACGLLAVLALGYTAIDHFLPDRPFMAGHGDVFTTGGVVESLDAEGWGAADLESQKEDAERLVGMIPPKNDLDHVLVPITPLPRPPELLQPIADRLPHDILSSYYLHGDLPASTTAQTAPQQARLDIVYLWVNATSAYFQEALSNEAEKEGLRVVTGKGRRWRDNGELKPAVRSAVHGLGGALRKIHLLTGDYEFDSEEHREELPYEDEVDPDLELLGWRAGQVPDWLDWNKVASGQGMVTWHPHSEVFRLPLDEGRLPSALENGSGQEEDKWRDEALPSFDSFEIESRIGWLRGLSENFVLSNDDMFILSTLSASDFHHPLLGTVVRFAAEPGLFVRPEVTNDLHSTTGEWGGLQHASLLLSRRFPAKSRPYMHHMPKSLTRSLVQEASVMFAEDLTMAATRTFRESRRGVADVEIAWLVSHLGVERWREALLWSWAVAKVGGAKGIWGKEAREEVRRVMGVKEGQVGGNVKITRGERKTLEDIERVTKQAGWELPEKTTYLFSSMDGHIPGQPGSYPAGSTCTLSLSTCFPSDFFTSSTSYSAQSIFRGIAFEHPECGDCIINALITASGDRGLAAILPEAEAVFFPPEKEPRMWERSEPMLPLTSHWEGSDFSLAEVVRNGQDAWAGISPREDGGVRLREWCIKLLSRYAYTHANTPSHFAQIHSIRQLESELEGYDSREDLAMVCLNDDQPDGAGERNREVFEKWGERRWGGVEARWERGWGVKVGEGNIVTNVETEAGERRS